MAYFNRLTEIVTCNLTQLLKEADDPQSAIVEIVAEMREGLAGAERSLRTASQSVERLRDELAEERRQAEACATEARQKLASGDEDGARLALVRRKEGDAVVAGLEQQLTAAQATREHLETTLHALQARLADALRRQRELGGDEPAAAAEAPAAARHRPEPGLDPHAAEIDAELEALKRELDPPG